MPTQTLTCEFINSLSQQSPTRTTCYFDTEIKGFLLEHRRSGRATYYYRYRNLDGVIRMTRIGTLVDIPLSDARAQAHRLRLFVREGGDPKVESNQLKDIPTFERFIKERYLPYAQIRKRSWQTDLIILRNHLLPRFAEMRLQRITRSDVLDMHHALRNKGYAAGTCNRILVLLKFIFNCAIRWEVLRTANPCSGVDAFADYGARERYLTHEEVQRLFAELDQNRNTQVANIVKLLLYTGARKREILNARWEYVDFDRKLLTVPLSKSGKPRYIALSDAAIELLGQLPRYEGVPWVFYNEKTGKAVGSIFYAWNTIRNKLGLPDVRLHDLRHSFASFLVSSGRSLYEVQRLLGHHDPKVTMRYAHLSPGAMLEAVNSVGKTLPR